MFLTSRRPIRTKLQAMQFLRQYLLISGIAVAGISEGSEKSAASPPLEEKKTSNAAGVTFQTAEAIKAMPASTVTFVKRLSEFSGSFREADGKDFVLGGSRGDQAVWHFVTALKEGQVYKLPDEFVSYQTARPHVNAKEIAAMAPCTATVAARSPCSSTFRTMDGKWLSIGDPGSEPQVSHFISSLPDGETVNLPDAFLAYQAAPRYVTPQEITEMPACTARFTRAWDKSGYFKTADGKQFFIGDKQTAKDVARFISTLKEGTTYEFPGVFLEYQKKR
jgi:hypothetical protein